LARAGGVRLGQPKANSRPSAGVCWLGTHAFLRSRARRAAHSPVSRRHTRRCRCGEVRHPTLMHASKQDRVEAWLTHSNSPSGDGEFRGMDCPARRGRPHMQLDWPTAKSRAHGGGRGPQPCLSTRGLAMSAQRGHLETGGAARGGAQCPLQEKSRLDSRFTHKILARRRRAQGHEWPRSATLSRGGNPAARWPALRHVHMAARLDAAGPTQGSIQGGGKEKMDAQCSRWVGGVVMAGSVWSFTSAM
jgi:hypothetical protein